MPSIFPYPYIEYIERTACHLNAFPAEYWENHR
jgi:hypothetical protein